jgi:hypothetical protein
MDMDDVQVGKEVVVNLPPDCIWKAEEGQWTAVWVGDEKRLVGEVELSAER